MQYVYAKLFNTYILNFVGHHFKDMNGIIE